MINDNVSANKKNILLLSTADWDNPFWTNKQHVASELSRLGYKVLYIDSLGLRAPSINKSDISRIFKRLRKGLKLPQNVSDNLWVWSPIVIPLQKYSFIRLLNKYLLHALLSFYKYKLGFSDALLWTYNPITVDILPIKRSDKVVYHCVDEIKAQPGMPSAFIEEAEKRLLKRADYSFVTSNQLYVTKKKWAKNISMFSNVADFEHFNTVASQQIDKPTDMQDFDKPIIGFIGAISGYKQDFALLSYIAKTKPNWHIVLIGKVGEGDPNTNVAGLEQYENISFFGPRSYSLLPAYINAFDVAIIPAALNDYTHSMFPMKFFEYLATGKRIVSTKIDSLNEYSEFAYLADDYDDFVKGIEDALDNRVGNLNARLQLAKTKTYKARTLAMMEIIEKS